MHRRLWSALPFVLALAICLFFGRLGADKPVAAQPQADCVVGPHSGTLSTSQDWCPEHNPHQVTNNVTVADGVTLNLRPGVIVQTASGRYIRVNGTLTAIGTPAQPITLTSSTDSGPGQWAGLYLSSGEADLRYVTLRYAGQYNGWGRASINVAYSALRLENSTVRDSADPANPDYGVHLCCGSGQASAIISNTTFINIGNATDDVGVFTSSSSNPITVTHSTFQNIAGYPIQLVPPLVHQVTDNTFSGNSFDRILMSNGSTADGVHLMPQNGLEGYELSGQLRVPESYTLYIDPGVMLMGRNGVDVRVYGYLEAIGTPTQPITFTSATNTGPEQWGSLYAQDGSLNLEYVTLRYGGQFVGGNQICGALFLQSTGGQAENFNLNHVTIRDNACTSVTFPPEYTVTLNGDNITMNHTAIFNNGNAATDVTLLANAGVLTATHSVVQNNAGHGLRVSGGRAGLTCGTVANNGGDGIAVTGGAAAIIGTGIYSNTGMGLNNTTVNSVTAAYNWWGDASGPGGVGPGSGDEVSDKVVYAPWLTAEGCFTGLLIDKTAQDVNGGPLLAPGDLIRYTLYITNTGNIIQHDLLVTDTLPLGVTFVSATPPGFAGPNPLQWQQAALTPGATWTGAITVTVNSGVAEIGGNVAQASSDEQDRIQTAAILPPGGGQVAKMLFLPLALRE